MTLTKEESELLQVVFAAAIRDAAQWADPDMADIVNLQIRNMRKLRDKILTETHELGDE